MLWEAAAAVAVGALVLWLVLQPLLGPGTVRPLPPEPVDPEETPTGVALTALKEIEFDRATGKLSEADYEQLKARYTAAAVQALRAESAEAAPDEVEAMIAAKVRVLRSARASTSPGGPSDTAGLRTVPGAGMAPPCATCGPRPEPDAVFCSTCGLRLGLPATCARCAAPLPPESSFCEACGSQVAA
jgi:hypothetical protein